MTYLVTQVIGVDVRLGMDQDDLAVRRAILEHRDERVVQSRLGVRGGHKN
jgi:hypothetical protein